MAVPAPLRVVVDTNVLISAALLPKSVPATLLRYLLAHARLVFSEATFAELETRLWKPKFDRYLTLDARRRLLVDLGAVTDWVARTGQQRFSRDADDDIFIHTALAADARWLVSGDDDLLVLGEVEAVRILTPRAALDLCLA